MKIQRKGPGQVQPQSSDEVELTQQSSDIEGNQATRDAEQANFEILNRELQALGFSYGNRTGMRQNELSHVLTQHPELIDSALRLAYLRGGQTTSPQLSESTSLNLATFNYALNDLIRLARSAGSTQNEANIDDYLSYSPITYAARQLKPDEQRLLYAQLMATGARKRQADVVETDTPAPPAKRAKETPTQSVNTQVRTLLQEGETLFDGEDFAGAYNKFAEATKLAPNVAKQLPELNYYLGVSARYSGDSSLETLAASYYEKYLSTPGGSASTKAWVKNDLAWIKAGPEAEAASKQAQDWLWKENNPYNALNTLKAAVEKYPQLTSRDPTTYYFLAIYAYSAGDLSAAKKYIADAKSAFLSRDQNDPAVKYYLEQIDKMAQDINTFKFSTWSTDKLRQGLSAVLGDGPMAQKISKAVSSSLSNWYVPGARWSKETSTRYWEFTADKAGSFRTEYRKREDSLLDEAFEGAQYKIFDKEKLSPLEYIQASELKAETFAKAQLDVEAAKPYLSASDYAKLEKAKTNKERVEILKGAQRKMTADALKAKDELGARIDKDPDSVFPKRPETEVGARPIEGIEQVPLETRMKLLRGEKLTKKEFDQVMDVAPDAILGRAPDHDVGKAPEGLQDLSLETRMKLLKGEKLSQSEFDHVMNTAPEALLPNVPKSDAPDSGGKPSGRGNLDLDLRMKLLRDEQLSADEFRRVMQESPKDVGLPEHDATSVKPAVTEAEFQKQFATYNESRDQMSRADAARLKVKAGESLSPLEYLAAAKLNPQVLENAQLDRSQLPLEARLDMVKAKTPEETLQVLRGIETKLVESANAEAHANALARESADDLVLPDVPRDKPTKRVSDDDLEARLARLNDGKTTKAASHDDDLEARLARLKDDGASKSKGSNDDLEARLARLKDDGASKSKGSSDDLEARLARLKDDGASKSKGPSDDLEARLARLKDDGTSKSKGSSDDLEARLARLKDDGTSKSKGSSDELEARLARLKEDGASKSKGPSDDLEARLARLKDDGASNAAGHDDDLVLPDVPKHEVKPSEDDVLQDRLNALRDEKESRIKPLRAGLTAEETRLQQMADLATIKAGAGEKLTPNEFVAASKLSPEILGKAELDHSELPSAISEKLKSAKSPEEKAQILQTLDEATLLTKAERESAKRAPLSDEQTEAQIRQVEELSVPDHEVEISIADKISKASDKAVDAVKNSAIAQKLEDAGFKVNARKLEDRELAPGWWGGGTTLARAQAAAFQWSLGQGADGSITNDWRGPFATTSNYDPTSQQVSLINSGEGLEKKYLGVNLGVNMLNAEARAYGSYYGGGSDSFGIGAAVGAQVRANVMDVNAGINYSAGSTTIGDTKIDNLFGASVMGQASAGVQADANVALVASKEKVQVGASLGGFAGAQASGMASVNALGVGANVTGQAWAGVGAKLTANASYEHGKLSFNLGIGAALGYGGYVELGVTIDFNQIANMLKGAGEAGVVTAADWGNTAPGIGHAAGFVAGMASGAAQLVADTAGAIGKTAEGIGDALTKTGVLAPVGIPLQQAGQLLGAPSEVIASSKKSSTKAFEEARNAFKEGKVFTGIAKGVGGSIKAVGEGLIGLFGGQSRKKAPTDDKS